MKGTVAERAQQEAKRMEKKYGRLAGSTGDTKYKLNVIPTGSLALDYALGTGGWPRRQVVEIFGPPDIGKSSILGFMGIKNAQKLGLLCGIVAMEPNFDPSWAYKNGVDPTGVVIGRPDHGEDAFRMLYDWVTGDLVDFILFDSIGAVLSESETEEKGKSKVGGQSGLITWGVKRILVPTWKNEKTVLLINQVRDNMKAQIPGLVESPGGWALKHSATQRIEMKSKGKAFTEGSGEEEVTVGRRIVCIGIRNKMTEGSRQKAEFDFWYRDTEDHPLGIDWADDVISTAIRTKVIKKAGGWFAHSSFPGAKNQLNGRESVEEFLHEHPEVVETIREEVVAEMIRRQDEQAKKDAEKAKKLREKVKSG